MKWLYSGYAVAVSILLLLALRVVDPTPLQSLRGQVFDSYQQFDEIIPSQDIVLLNFGENTLATYGQYPFPRQYYAQLVVDVASKNAGVLGWTIMFPEQDRFQGDASFADMLMQNKVNVPGARRNPINYNVLSQTPSIKGIKTSGPHIGTGTIGPVPAKNYLLKWPNLVTNVPVLEAVVNGKGVNASAPQPDNQTRTYPLAITVEDKIYPSFAVEMLRVSRGQKSYIVKTSEIGIQEVAVKGVDPIVTQPDGTAYIRFNNSFETIEYTGADSIPDLAGKMVIVGVTAEGIANPVPTPRGNLYPQQIQAHMLQNFIDGSNITRSQLSAITELLIGLLTMVLVALAVYRLPLLLTAPIALTVLGGIAYYSVKQYTGSLVLVDATFPVLSGFLVFTQAAFNNFYKQFKLREQIKKQFEHYLAPAMVKKLQKDPSLLKLGGDTRTMTYLFSDIRGFTPISEQFKTDPQGLGKLINRYMTPMTDLVMRKEGTIDKYIGDALMAIWNAPLDVDNHAQLAIETAQEMEVELKNLNKELKEDGLMELGVGIGINTGDAVVGNMGSNQRFDYTVLGDSVNLAARLEAQTKEYGVFFMFTEHTLKEILSPENLTMLDKIAVKGQTDPVTIYTILNDHKYARVVNRMVDAYQNREWATCSNQIEIIKDHNWNDTLAELYAERIKKPMPTGDWDGIERKTSK
ncbi:adenylate/guanylate cyclase domain-containing protein [bacterium]|nr:adenylate/guanylate cyclase domain-containing protein [bacterium]